MKTSEISAALERAVEGGLISAPHFPFLPPGFPMAIAVSSVKRPDGCLPPLGGRNLLGSGTGPSQDVAGFRAMCEAAERYALQFDPTRPDILWPIQTLGGKTEEYPITKLCLGSPNGPVSSKGCAAGDTHEDATDRAAFELLEHHALAAFDDADAISVDPASIAEIADLNQYLNQRLRQITLLVTISKLGYCGVRAILTDPDGGRPTYGSCAAPTIAKAATKSVHEAVLSWRNMIELERNDVTPQEGDRLLGLYRGAEKQPAVGRGTLIKPPQIPPMTSSPLEVLASALDCRVQVFDMSVGGLDIPVVRVCPDQQ